ncbi:MAG: hypothetical protein JW754_03550 [Candidatus Aenigmarchaeota archaeon]|nr:hypothetical protein [Candidatus Aenigmarchaeota archaeon]
MVLEMLPLEIIIPFIFVFAIVYGAMEFSAVMKNRKVSMVVSLCMAFFAITNQQVVNFVNQVLPYAAIFFVIVFFIGFVKRPFKGGGGGNPVLLIIVLGLILLLFVQFGSDTSPFYSSIQGSFLGNENLIMIIGFVIVVVMFYYAFVKLKNPM